METGILHLHSTLAFIVLAGLAAAIIMAIAGKPMTDLNRKVAKIAMILLHTQFLIGAVLYFISARGFASLSADAMKDATIRLYAVEHPIAMIVALVLVTIGHAKVKRAAADAANKPLIIFYTLGLLVLLSRIPWATWI